METHGKKSVNYYMRLLHRNVGFFLIGFVIIYSLSGIALIYRDTDLLKKEKKIITNLPAGLTSVEVGSALKIRDFKALKTEGNMIYYQSGSYNTSTGKAEYNVKELVFPFNKMAGLHKTASKNILHWFTLAFGIALLIMAISSLWMYKTVSRTFRIGILTTFAGITIAVILLFV
jgi:hypothetical protein